MIDIGVNLFSSQFDGEHEELLAEAYQAGINAVLITGTTVANSHQAQAFCQQRPPGGTRCFATAGVHPHHAQELDVSWLQELEQLAKQPEVVALGEMGLDYFRNFSNPSSQRQCFTAQASLASESDLPLFVHDRDASADTLKILQQELLRAGHTNLSRVVVHCFTGSAKALQAYLEAGCYIGITGWVCDQRRGQALRELIPQIPLSRLLIETDAPYLRPQNAPSLTSEEGSQLRSKNKRRNTPALLPYVANTLAELLGVSEAEVRQHSSDNAELLFNLNTSGATTAPPVAS